MISVLLLSACASSELHLPDELLAPCPLDDSKPIVTQTDTVDAYSDAVTALACANGRIKAIADIYYGVAK